MNPRTKALLLTLAIACLATGLAWGQQTPAPDANPLGANLLNFTRDASSPQNVSQLMTLVMLLTVLSLAPAVLVMTTSFTRIIVVFGFLRQALATQQTPPNQVLVGLALFLTFFIMAPTYERVNREGLQPYVRGELTRSEALERGMRPMREFMFKQSDAKALALFLRIGKIGRPATPNDVPTHVLINAFVLSELKTAFQIGFIIYIPFLIIDMVVASTLMSMGMMMLPPVLVSLPFKIIMFVLADGWYLIIESLVRSFR